jgi:lantibiotic biosynthesis protein
MGSLHEAGIQEQARDFAVSVAATIWAALDLDPAPQQAAATAAAARPLAPSTTADLPAVALLFAELAAHDPAWRPRLHAALTSASARLRASPANGLFAGPMSFGFALHMAGIATGGYGSARAKVDAALRRRVLSQWSNGELAARIEGGHLTMADYDLVSGLSGVLRYLLLEPARNADAVALVLRQLVAIVRSGQPGRPGWSVAHPPMIGTEPTDFPRGHANVGMAHGAAGILAALSIAIQAGMRVPEQEQAIALLSEWLLTIQLADTHGTIWPSFIALHRQAATPTTRPRGWCYGTPGIARALQLASDALGDVSLRAAADAAILSMVARPVGEATADEASLCHGLAGTLQVVWRCATSATVQIPASWVESVARDLLARYEPDSRLGYNTRPLQWTDAYSVPKDLELITGVTGICLALHRFSRGAPPATPWDAALLMV